MTQADKNTTLLENFILFLTHSSDEREKSFKEPQSYTPEQLYQTAIDYIEEDHVDGKENPENNKPTINQEQLKEWSETHYQIVSIVNFQIEQDNGNKFNVIQEREGSGGIMDICHDLTNKFQEIHKDTIWDGEWYEEIELFVRSYMDGTEYKSTMP